MHFPADHYHVLGVTYSASTDDIKKAFKALAVLYHPDKNPGSYEAEEIFKRITTAYRILSDPEQRKKYDYRLTWFALGVEPIENDPTQDPEYRRKYGISKRNLRSREEKVEEEIREYEEEIRQTPEYIRFALSGVIAAWGLQLIFTNWFLNYADYRIFLLVLGFGLFIGGTLFFTKVLYNRLAIRNLKRPFKFNFEYLCFGVFLTLVAIGISLTILLCSLKKQYDLNHYASTTVGQVYQLSRIEGRKTSEIWYEFVVNGTVVRKPFTLSEGEKFGRGDQVIVKYSMVNPNIATVIGRPQ